MLRLRCKTTALLACVVLAATGLSAALYVNLSSTIVTQEAHWRARELARTLGVSAAMPIAAGDRSALVGIAQDLVSRHSIRYVAFSDPAGNVLAGAQGSPGQLSTLLYGQGTLIPLAPLDTPVLVAQGDEIRVDVTCPVFAAGLAAPGEHPPVLGYVRLGESLAQTSSRIAGLTWQVCGVAGAIALLMIPLGYVIVARIAAPLNALRDASAAWARGEFDVRVSIRRADEIGDVAAAFNRMADELARSRQALVAINAELEDRVMARTYQLGEANRQLRQEMAEREDFLRAISHDLHAPLRNVAGIVGLLRSRHQDQFAPDAQAMIERIDHNVRHELDLINELMELASLRSRRDPPMRVDLDAEVRAIAGRLGFEMGQKNITLDLPRPLPVVFAEKARMLQLFGNLIDNAVKYTDPARRPPTAPPPCIRITWTEHPQSLEFRVADHGIGIEPRDRERVFYVFRRGKNSLVARTPGKGVGLATCKGIVQNYGGRIWVEPNPEGGSIVGFTLARSRVDLGPRRGDSRGKPEHAPEAQEAAACPAIPRASRRPTAGCGSRTIPTR